MMKALLIVSIFTVAGYVAHATTAYDALRVVGKERGDAMLDQVVEVRGSKGAPEPGTWKVIVVDKDARGGVREFDVRGTQIVGERTPANAAPGRSLNLNVLNLDSDGAHTVTEREAKKAAFAYDYVEYTLRAGSGAPVWELRLVDDRNGNVATASISADSGKMLSSSGFDAKRPVRVADKDPNDRPTTRPPQPRVREEEENEEVEDEAPKQGNKVTRFLDRAGRNIGGAFDRFGDKVGRFGERVGEKVNRTFSGGSKPPAPRSTPPPATSNSYRDKNGTEFYRPRD